MLLDPRSEVVETDDGWVWLRPEPRSLRRRQTLAWALLTLSLGAGAAGIAFLEPLPGALLALGGLLAAIVLARAATRAAHTRVGACRIGLLVQMGARVVQAGWDAVGELRVQPAGRRRGRLVLALEDGPTHATRTTFGVTETGAWLARAAAEAEAARQSVRPVDGGFALR